MKIEIELKGFNGFGWKVCDNCPCRRTHLGAGCELGYFENPTFSYENGWLNTVTGHSRMERTVESPNEPGTWYSVWLRPLECIDEHGR